MATTLDAPVSTDEASILELLSALHQAHHGKNPEAIAAPFAPHADIFDLEPPLRHDGISIERKRKWLATWSTPVDIEPRDLTIKVNGDAAYVYGYLKMSGIKNGPDHAVGFWMRWTVLLERQTGNWRIVHEHTSVPFYMDETLRPAFDLQP